ncbi:Zinc finger protein GLIS3 [Eumeta japonica]|uniref:Zinc finger protein GLIS3 n=1 Tax=Eumeta variegata TaxID=151549 RepID=A0A4C1UJU8_EUMVA|nr:Zinc finger protein GLIS3 [Eumeta japonica]
MTQFNLELENGSRSKDRSNDSNKYNADNFEFQLLDPWNDTNNTPGAAEGACEFEIIDEVLENNAVNEESMKEVLFDLDSIEFDDGSDYTNATRSENTSANTKSDYEQTCVEANCDYIDDESLLDELCREDNENCASPDIFNDNCLSSASHDNLLPPIETAFSKRYCNYTNRDASIPQNGSEFCNNLDITPISGNNLMINNLDSYSYPNNILYNITSQRSHELGKEMNTDYNRQNDSRKLSVCESIESDVQSMSYFEEGSDNFDDDELFVNLDDFGLVIENEEEELDHRHEPQSTECYQKKIDRDAGEKTCLWEHCYDRYPNQTTLVDHIERCHVNTYKGDEFSCLWSGCARARRPFNARYKLLIHMRVHSGHKPNRCNYPGCGKAFSRLENLKIHMRSHTGERPYACPAPHCRKAFSNSSDRAKHQRTHFNARPYACGAVGCGKRYTDPSSLRKHVKSHPHMPSVPRNCIPSARPVRRPQGPEQTVPSSPAKLATLRCIRDKLTTVPRLQL